MRNTSAATGASYWLAWGLVLTAVSMSAHAMEFTVPYTGSDPMTGTLNTTLTAGGALRMQGRNVDLIGKANLNPDLCYGSDGRYQGCQGLAKDQLFPAQRLASAPGAPSTNGDDGDLDYGKYDLVQAVVKVTQDITLNYKNFGFFGRWLYFYDAVNNDFTEYHPNRITPDNLLHVGRFVPYSEIAGIFTHPGVALLDFRPYGQPVPGGTLVYGPGGVVRNKRTDGETLREAGTNLQYLDSYLFGLLPIPYTDDKNITFKLGRQVVNWGESTTLVLYSLNQANPINANNVTRVGSQVDEIFTPVNMISLQFPTVKDVTLSGFYQLEWKNDEAPAPGTFFSTVDLGTNNAIKTGSISFGGGAEDPDCVEQPLDNPFGGATSSTACVPRLPDHTARSSGQYGMRLQHYAHWLNDGTDISLYFMHYHSRLPYVSGYAANPSCARREGNRLGIDVTNVVNFIVACPDLPLIHSLLHPGQSAGYATSSILQLDSIRLQLEYPEDIDMLGFSFNTTAGDYSLQGEVAYRPQMPMQVDVADLGFAALGPTLSRCHEQALHCVGSPTTIGYGPDGNAVTYGRSDYPGYNDTFDGVLGAIPGSGRSFPNFIIPYRGGTVGENPGCPRFDSTGLSMADYTRRYWTPGSSCYIRGWERFQMVEFNLGATRILSASENPIGASQMVFLFEAGATWVPDLPPLDRLQLQGPGADYHASAGADGSGADGSRMACSTSPDCLVGPDGLRFNPHQQDPKGFPSSVSWGYRLITQISYENVLPNINLRPLIIASHDVQGTAPGPGSGASFVAGTKSVAAMVEARYHNSFSANLGYTWFWGGGAYNPLSDRDYLQFFLKYQF
ncbi:MAG: DUF1302 family protein [Nevskia sp.]|nr:DUF1302 family protein [Nevskia sp.]